MIARDEGSLSVGVSEGIGVVCVVLDVMKPVVSLTVNPDAVSARSRPTSAIVSDTEPRISTGVLTIVSTIIVVVSMRRFDIFSTTDSITTSDGVTENAFATVDT